MFSWDDSPDLNITPLVDVMLVLMAILMITAPTINSAIRDRGVITGSFTQVEVDTLFHQPFYTPSAVANRELHSIPVAQTSAGDQGILDM